MAGRPRATAAAVRRGLIRRLLGTAPSPGRRRCAMTGRAASHVWAPYQLAQTKSPCLPRRARTSLKQSKPRPPARPLTEPAAQRSCRHHGEALEYTSCPGHHQKRRDQVPAIAGFGIKDSHGRQTRSSEALTPTTSRAGYRANASWSAPLRRGGSALPSMNGGV